MTSQSAKTELINWRRQLEKLNQPIDAEAWDYAIAAIDALDRIKACDAISRHDAIKEIMGQPTELHYPDWYAEQINNMPPIEPERKPGKWIIRERHEHYPSGKSYEEKVCPVCGRTDHNGDGDWCGYCGANMGGKQG